MIKPLLLLIGCTCILSLLIGNRFANGHELQNRMKGGTQLSSGNFSSLITVVTILDHKIQIICENVLISPLYVLTHVQCQINAKIFAVAGKTMPFYLQEQYRLSLAKRIVRGIRPQGYYKTKEEQNKYKLGLFIMESPMDIPVIKPALLVKNKKKSNAIIVGWANILEGTLKQRLDLQYIESPILTNRQCLEKVKDACETGYVLGDTKFCSDDKYGTDLGIYEDVGSPIFVNEKKLLGLVDVNMYPNGAGGCPSINILAASQADFINHFVPDAKWVHY